MEEVLEENIRKVRNYTSNIFNEFNIWKSLQRLEYNEIYNKNKYFWGAVIYSLQAGFLLELVKVFENRKKKDVLSIYYLLDYLLEGQEKEEIIKELNNHYSIIKNLIIWRNNILAHHNIFFAHNPQELFKRFPVKNNEIEKLINLLEKTLGMIHSIGTKTGQVYSFKLIREESQRDTKDIINRLVMSYKKIK